MWQFQWQADVVLFYKATFSPDHQSATTPTAWGLTSVEVSIQCNNDFWSRFSQLLGREIQAPKDRCPLAHDRSDLSHSVSPSRMFKDPFTHLHHFVDSVKNVDRALVDISRVPLRKFTHQVAISTPDLPHDWLCAQEKVNTQLLVEISSAVRNWHRWFQVCGKACRHSPKPSLIHMHFVRSLSWKYVDILMSSRRRLNNIVEPLVITLHHKLGVISRIIPYALRSVNSTVVF